MLIVCFGMFKRASTYTFQVIEDIIKRDCLKKSVDYIKISDLVDNLEFSFIGENTDIKLVIDAINSSKYDFWGKHDLIVKTHLPVTFFESELPTGATKAVLNCRHPAEIELSLVDAAQKEIAVGEKRFVDCHTFEKALEQLPYQIDTFLSWYHSKNIISHSVSYDYIAQKPINALREGADFIGVDFDKDNIVVRYEKDSSKIVEFNKSIFGRRFKEIKESFLNEIEVKFSGFCKLLEVIK